MVTFNSDLARPRNQHSIVSLTILFERKTSLAISHPKLNRNETWPKTPRMCYFTFQVYSVRLCKILQYRMQEGFM